jgi:hypothetical protein
MKVFPTFDIPESIWAGLIRGELTRKGSVVQRVGGSDGEGEVMMWLRETGATPRSPDSLAGTLGRGGEALSLSGSVASVLSLGATMAFGNVVYRKLALIDARLKEMDQLLDQLQWTVEAGFASLQGALEQIGTHQELELLANVRAAARLAWEAQALKPKSSRRVFRLENALLLSTQASEQYVVRTHAEMDVAIRGMLANPAVGGSRLAVPARTLAALKLLRQACVSSSLRALIQAETSSPTAAAVMLSQHHAMLRPLLARLGHAFLRGCELGVAPQSMNYDDLLNKRWRTTITAPRLAMWIRRFDPDTQDLAGAIDLIRQYATRARVTELGSDYEWKADTVNLPAFADLLDGAHEDLERLEGNAAEYRTAGAQNMTMQQYRDKLVLQEDSRPLVFFVPTR